MSTVDPLEAALGGEQPEPSGTPDAGTPNQGAAVPDLSQHPVVQSRFGGDVQKALDAYAQLDREYGQQGQRLGQQVADLQSVIAEMQAQQAPQPEPSQNGGYNLPDMSVDQLQAWFEEDPAQATAYLVAQGQQMLMEQIDQTLDQRLKPMESQVGRTTATSLVDGLRKAVGDDVVARNADVLVALQKEDPNFFQGEPTAIFKRMKMAVLAADAEAGVQRGASNGAATPPADVAVMGGSGGRNPSEADSTPLSPGDEFKAALLAAQGEERDAFGNPRVKSA